MRLTKISLENVRSYSRLSLPFTEEPRQIFVGPNGSGKTNLIEAISFLSWGRSCLKCVPDDVLRWESDYFRIRSEGVLDDGSRKTLEYVWQKAPRRKCASFVNDVRLPLLQFIGALKTVIFLPEDLDLFVGSPSGRRNFVDMLMAQIDNKYSMVRVEYEKVLRQRNALLKRISVKQAGADELDLWDGQLTLLAAEIQIRRSGLIHRISQYLKPALGSLGEMAGDAEMIYDRKTTGEEPGILAGEIEKQLLESRQRDLILTSTTVGPHRDDWHIFWQGHRLQQFASRGQQRACLLALLLVSAGILERESGEKPLVLLDDVLSELDDKHQTALIDSLKDHQVMITSTHGVSGIENLTQWQVGFGKIENLKLKI